MFTAITVNSYSLTDYVITNDLANYLVILIKRDPDNCIRRRIIGHIKINSLNNKLTHDDKYD